MANNTINVTYKVNDDGSLERIATKANKAADATNRASGASDNYNKKQKGVAGATSNSTKAFSKMTSGISTGLVPAYAEIAARVFALTAAFNVLSRNNAIIKLEESLNFMGRSAGRNLPIVVQSLKDITGAAISTEQAMRAAAVGTSSGFSSAQLEGLAKVAKGASIALGRDMGDAMDRLVRGAAKLEPEIVDELGIMVRLDDAVEQYAIRMNKATSELTQYERRMAFTNDIIDQGIRKFGDISEAIEPSAYDRLSSSLSDLSKVLIGGLSSVFAPILEFLSQHTLALGGLVAGYGSLVAGSIIGGIQSLAAASAQAAIRTEKQAEAALKAIKPHDKLGKAFNEQALSNDRSVKSLDRMRKSLNTTINMTSKDTQKLKVAIGYRNVLTAEIYKQNLAQIKSNFTMALGTLQEVGITAGIQAHITALRELSAATAATAAQQTFFAAATTVATGVLAGLGATASFVGALLLTVMPYIAAAAALVGILYPLVASLFEKEDDRLEKQTQKNTERFEEFNNVAQQFATTITKADSASEAWYRTLKPISGLLTELSSAIDETLGAASVTKITSLAAATEKLQKAQRVEKLYSSPYMTMGPGPNMMAQNAARMQAKDMSKAAQEEIDRINVQNLQRVKEELGRGIGSFNQSLSTMEAKLVQMKDAGKPVGEALTTVQEALKKSNSALKNLLSGEVTPEDTAVAMRDLALETNSAINAFENFSSVLGQVKKTFGDTTATWGDYGTTIDKVQEGINTVNAILENGSPTAANDKAKEILKAMGIAPEDLEAGETAVERLKSQQAKMIQLNDDIKAHQLKSAKHGMFKGGEASQVRTDSQTQLMLDAIAIQKRKTEDAVDGTKEEREELLKLYDLVEKYNASLSKTSDILNKRAGRLGGEGAEASSVFSNTMGDLFKQTNENGETIVPGLGDITETLNSAMGPMIENLKKLGPEGELVAAVAQGALNIAESFTTAFQSIEDGGSKVQAGLQMAGAMVNALASMQQAQSKAAIAGIDREIDAEKKRDGQSAASQAKIAALEKKKDAMKRKAFEQNKKMQMASTIINTASAIVSVLDDAPTPYNFILAGLVGAMGAAQLGIISSMSYQGGGSSGGGAPTSISVGSRNNSVDMAKGRSPAGEIAYARGAQGTGSGMTNYTPAFTGMKYRASGGNTGFMVGEQGPEIFVPDRPGTIVPADEAAAGSSQPMNVNFSISAVDAAGIEDLLIRQRGNLIGMIREAANAHGESFLESVTTQNLEY